MEESSHNKEEVRRGTCLNWSEEEKGIYTSPNSWLNSVDSMKILAKVFDESIAKMILCVPLLPASLTSAD